MLRAIALYDYDGTAAGNTNHHKKRNKTKEREIKTNTQTLTWNTLWLIEFHFITNQTNNNTHKKRHVI